MVQVSPCGAACTAYNLPPIIVCFCDPPGPRPHDTAGPPSWAQIPLALPSPPLQRLGPLRDHWGQYFKCLVAAICGPSEVIGVHVLEFCIYCPNIEGGKKCQLLTLVKSLNCILNVFNCNKLDQKPLIASSKIFM